MATASATKPEWYDVPEDVYHADTVTLSHSQAEVFAKSPKKYKHEILDGKRKPPSPAQQVGSLVHRCLLTDDGEASIVVVPESVLSTNGRRTGKAWQEFCLEHEGKSLLLEEEATQLRGILAAVRDCKPAAKLLAKASRREAALRWGDELTGLSLRCRFDAICGRGVFDLKTCRDLSPEWFAKQALNLGYHRQAAWYAAGYRAAFGILPAWIFVCVTTEAPYDCQCYELSPDFMALGQYQNEKILKRFAEARSANYWQRPEKDSVLKLEAPRWAFNEEWSVEDE